MAELSEQEILEELKRFSTPSITNVVATYPGNPLCLCLYEPWRSNWYTDQSVHCIYPELGRTVGYAVTMVRSLPDPGYKGFSYLDLIEALGESKKPIVIVIQQDFPPEILPKVGMCGGQATTLFQACGAVGVVSNGPNRDVDEIRSLKFQYMMSGVTPGHGPMAIRAINIPVSVAGMDVSPGDIIHMDEHGACKFPADRLEDIYKNIIKLVKVEEEQAAAMSKAKTLEEIKAVYSTFLKIKTVGRSQ
ncbi:RraA family protein [Chloroflexota bacterium]